MQTPQKYEWYIINYVAYINTKLNYIQYNSTWVITILTIISNSIYLKKLCYTLIIIFKIQVKS